MRPAEFKTLTSMPVRSDALRRFMLCQQPLSMVGLAFALFACRGGGSEETAVSAAAAEACPAGSHVIIGTEGDDVLIGTNGKDCILGLGGNDEIRGGNGDDVLIGGDGNDRLAGGNGSDRLLGEGGNDILEGGNGADELIGCDGDDVLNGDNGPDRLFGGAGNDVILSSKAANIDGGGGFDVCRGTSCEVDPATLETCSPPDLACDTSGTRCHSAVGLCVPCISDGECDAAGGADAGVSDAPLGDSDAAPPPDASSVDAGAADANVQGEDASQTDAGVTDAGGTSTVAIAHLPAEFAVAGVEYRSVIAVRFASGEPTNYGMARGPPGLTVDSTTGEIVWFPSPSDAGVHTIEIAVFDGNIQERITFSITVGTTRVIASEIISSSRGGRLAVLATGTHLDGMTVDFAPGAIMTTTVVSVAVVDGVPPPAGGQLRIGESFVLLPHDLELATPAVLTYQANATFLPPGIALENLHPEFHDPLPERHNSEMGDVELLHSRTLDLAADTLSTEIAQTGVLTSVSARPEALQFVQSVSVFSSAMTATVTFDVWVDPATPQSQRTRVVDEVRDALSWHLAGSARMQTHGEVWVEPIVMKGRSSGNSMILGLVSGADPTVIHLNVDLVTEPLLRPRLPVTIAHEYCHVIQYFALGPMRFGYPSNDWLLEGGARYLEDAYDVNNMYLTSQTFDNTFTHSSLATSDGSHEYLAIAFMKYLAGAHGFNVAAFWNSVGVSDSLKAMFRRGSGAFDAVDSVLRTRHQTTFEEAFIDFVHQYNSVRGSSPQTYPGTIEDFEPILAAYPSRMRPPRITEPDEGDPAVAKTKIHPPMSGRSYRIEVEGTPDTIPIRLRKKDGGVYDVTIRTEMGGPYVGRISTREEMVELLPPVIGRELYVDAINVSPAQSVPVTLVVEFPLYTLVSVETCDVTAVDGIGDFVDHVGERFFDTTCGGFAGHAIATGPSVKCAGQPSAKRSECVYKFEACQKPLCTDEQETSCKDSDYERATDGIFSHCTDSSGGTLITSSAPVADDGFGEVVRMSGNTMAVSAEYDDRGAVYIFEHGELGWEQKAKFTPDTPGELFGINLALERDVLAVGYPFGNVVAGNRHGAVYVYTRSADGIWSQSAMLTDDGTGHQSEFGSSLAIADGRIIATSPWQYYDRDPLMGAAYVFERQGSAWVEVNRLHIPYDSSLNGVSCPQSLLGPVGMVGASSRGVIFGKLPYDLPQGYPCPLAYDFHYDGGSIWNPVGTLSPPTDSGVSEIDVAEDAAVVVDGTRQARLYTHDGSTWNLVGQLGRTPRRYRYANSVGMNANTIVARMIDPAQAGVEHTNVFQRNGNEWTHVGEIPAARVLPTCTWSPATDGDRVALGCPRLNRDSAGYYGGVYLVRLGSAL